jgi:hypothetical protein
LLTSGDVLLSSVGSGLIAPVRKTKRSRDMSSIRLPLFSIIIVGVVLVEVLIPAWLDDAHIITGFK